MPVAIFQQLPDGRYRLAPRRMVVGQINMRNLV